jgi:hypothetical protein
MRVPKPRIVIASSPDEVLAQQRETLAMVLRNYGLSGLEEFMKDNAMYLVDDKEWKP